MSSAAEEDQAAEEQEVRAVVARYEAALMADDLATLDALFCPGPTTIRADATGVLVSHVQISAFRRGRGGAPARTVTALHVVRHAPGVATALAETLRPDGTRGLQTQVWEKDADGWRIRAAHVSAGPPPAPRTAADAALERSDPAVWRVVGSPLVAPTGSGVLDGVQLAVKDLVPVAGHPVGAGNPVKLAEAPLAPAHAPVLAQLLAAGAAVRGIARTDELAYSLSGTNVHYGSPANPWGAALPWPSLTEGDVGDPPSDKRGHRPGRKAGALVVLVDGQLALYVERGGKTVLTFGASEKTIVAAAASLAATVRRSLGKLRVERVDGEFVVGTPLGAALADAGFSATPQGLRLRA